MDRFFTTVVLPNFKYGLSVYGASDSDVTAIQSFLNGSFKRKYISVKIDIRCILKELDLNLYKSHSISPCPISGPFFFYNYQYNTNFIDTR